MPTCPDGHRSADPDACDTCGRPIVPGWTCARGHAGQRGRFCEECGLMDGAPLPSTVESAGVAWECVASADRSYHESIVDNQGVAFPGDLPERRFALRGTRLLIGRRDPVAGVEPDIDLGSGVVDHGVSRRHALLVASDQGGWSLMDLDSVNGTYTNGFRAPIPPGTPVPLDDGDRVYLGAWTVLTIRILPAEHH